MSYYLLDHPNPNGSHFYPSRRGTVLAVVVHVTAGLEDLDGGVDRSAEATARYAATTDRAVSWHSGSDTDSSLDLLPAGFTAFHCKGYNSRTFGHEISKRSADWRNMPEWWGAATLHHAAKRLAVVARELGIPARHATRSELDDAIARNGQPVGFVGHHQLDPARRSDPGLVSGADTFPWQRFLGLVSGFMSPAPTTPTWAPPTTIYEYPEDRMRSEWIVVELDEWGRGNEPTGCPADKFVSLEVLAGVTPNSDGFYPGDEGRPRPECWATVVDDHITVIARTTPEFAAYPLTVVLTRAD